MGEREEPHSYEGERVGEELTDVDDVELPEGAPDELREVANTASNENNQNESERLGFMGQRWWGMLSLFWVVFWIVTGMFAFTAYTDSIQGVLFGGLILFGLLVSTVSSTMYLR